MGLRSDMMAIMSKAFSTMRMALSFLPVLRPANMRQLVRRSTRGHYEWTNDDEKYLTLTEALDLITASSVGKVGGILGMGSNVILQRGAPTTTNTLTARSLISMPSKELEKWTGSATRTYYLPKSLTSLAADMLIVVQ